MLSLLVLHSFRAAAAEYIERLRGHRKLHVWTDAEIAAALPELPLDANDATVRQLRILLDAVPARLREELEAAYDDLDTVFDVGAVRAALEGRLRSLESELAQVERLQRKFASIHSTLAQQAALAPKGVAAGGGGVAMWWWRWCSRVCSWRSRCLRWRYR